MRILLPPSETKSFGGAPQPLALESLSFADYLTTTRRAIAQDLQQLCATAPQEAAAALGLSAKQAAIEIPANAELFTGPTAPAITRYTGVLYDALDFGSLTTAGAQRALHTVCIGSALFGIIGAGDPIPHYRLSAGSSLPGGGTLRARWKGALGELVASWEGELVVDLRSGGYRALGPVPGAVTVDVVSESADGTRKTITHFNKHYKGLLTRVLVSSRARIDNVAALRQVARRAGLVLEADSGHPHALTLVVPAE